MAQHWPYLDLVCYLQLGSAHFHVIRWLFHKVITERKTKEIKFECMLWLY